MYANLFLFSFTNTFFSLCIQGEMCLLNLYQIYARAYSSTLYMFNDNPCCICDFLCLIPLTSLYGFNYHNRIKIYFHTILVCYLR